MKKIKQLYVVRKYIWANTASECIRKDKVTPPQDIWVDKDAIGFYVPSEE